MTNEYQCTNLNIAIKMLDLHRPSHDRHIIATKLTIITKKVALH